MVFSWRFNIVFSAPWRFNMLFSLWFKVAVSIRGQDVLGLHQLCRRKYLPSVATAPIVRGRADTVDAATRRARTELMARAVGMKKCMVWKSGVSIVVWVWKRKLRY